MIICRYFTYTLKILTFEEYSYEINVPSFTTILIPNRILDLSAALMVKNFQKRENTSVPLDGSSTFMPGHGKMRFGRTSCKVILTTNKDSLFALFVGKLVPLKSISKVTTFRGAL
jgi:hypothetical protein